MLAITASVIVANAFIMGYLGFTIVGGRSPLRIQDFARDASGVVTIIVQNTGDSGVVLSSVHVDDVPNVPDVYEVPVGSPAILGETVLPSAETAKIVLSGNYSGLDQVTVRLTRDDGWFIELTKNFLS